MAELGLSPNLWTLVQGLFQAHYIDPFYFFPASINFWANLLIATLCVLLILLYKSVE